MTEKTRDSLLGIALGGLVGLLGMRAILDSEVLSLTDWIALAVVVIAAGLHLTRDKSA